MFNIRNIVASLSLLAGCATGPCDQACMADHQRTARALNDAADLVQHRADHMGYPPADGCAFQPGGCNRARW